MSEDYAAGTDINIAAQAGNTLTSGVIVQGQIAVSGSVTILSGVVSVLSGAHVVADIAESGMGVILASGLHVAISGLYVTVESGAQVITQDTITVDGNVGISGYVAVESGAQVLTQDTIAISGYVEVQSGAFVTTQPDIGISGSVNIISGAQVITQDNITVDGDVSISGYVAVESGAQVITQPTIAISGYVAVQSGAHVITTVSGDITPSEYGNSVVYGRVQIEGTGTVITSGHSDRLSIMINNESDGNLRIGHNNSVASGVGFRIATGCTATVDKTKTPIYGAMETSGDYISFYDELL